MFRVGVLIAAGVAALMASSAGAEAARCRDAKGHFVACPAAAPAPAAAATNGRCRTATGRFIKCPAPTAAAAPGPSAPAARAGAPPANASARARAPMLPPVARTGVPVNSSATAPGAVTARCRDGTVSRSQHRSGACSHHGGVAAWM